MSKILVTGGAGFIGSHVCDRLVDRGALVSAYDPQDVKAREIFGDSVDFFDDKYETLKSTDALVLLTEWDEFGSPDYGLLHELMNGNALFDMRNK